MMAVDRATLDRLAKICALFGSDHMGERAAAAHRAEAIRLKAGVSWADLLTGVSTSSTSSSRRERPEFDPVTGAPAALLARCAPILTEWEREFLASIGSQRTLTQRQAERLGIVREKCAVWWAHGGRA